MYSFNTLSEKYTTYYVYKHSQAKFEKVRDKVLSSQKMAQLNEASRKSNIAPSEADFGSYINSIPYFILAGSETIAMAEFIAMQHWHDLVNGNYKLCSEYELFHKGEAIIRRWKIRL